MATKKKLDPLPATGTAKDLPHTGRAVKGCACLCCFAHRECEAQMEAQRRQEDQYGDAIMGRISFGANASDDLRKLLGGL